MRVLFLSSWTPSSRHPFNGNFVFRHAESVAMLHEVTYLNITSDPLADKSVLAISPRLNFEEIVINSSKVPVFGKIINRLFHFFSFFRYLQTLKKQQSLPDVVHVNVTYPIGLYGLLVKLIWKIPYVVTEHWTGYLPRRSKELSRFHKMAAKIICRNASFICPVSHDLSKSMQKLGLKGRYHVVPNAVDTSIYKQRKKDDKNTKRIVHISSLNEDQKNITGIVNVLKRLVAKYEFEFVFVSESSFDGVKDLIAEREIESDRIKFLGPLSPAGIADTLLASDLFVLFSRYENLPCVIAESLIAGTPVISSDVGGIAEMVSSNNGRLVKAEDENALYDVVAGFIEGELVFDCENIRRQAAEKYGYGGIANEFSRLYEMAVKSV
jgi:glycosyltransferase involved in cell wall biosynthesis